MSKIATHTCKSKGAFGRYDPDCRRCVALRANQVAFVDTLQTQQEGIEKRAETPLTLAMVDEMIEVVGAAEPFVVSRQPRTQCPQCGGPIYRFEPCGVCVA